MEIYMQNVPNHVNHFELKVYLTDILAEFDILAFDVRKRLGYNRAFITVANAEKAQQFLNRYGVRYGRRCAKPLKFKSMELICKKSNNKGQPEPIHVNALLIKEGEMRAKKMNQLSTPKAPQSTQPTFQFQTLMTGVWEYDHLHKLVFDQKFKDERQGSVTFGKNSLVIFLKNGVHQKYNWHGRIDIPYATLEHVIPSADNGKRDSVTFTLKTPPKIYMIQRTDDLHLYTGNEMTDLESRLMQLLKISEQTRREPKLERLCTLSPERHHQLNSALCMVYKLSFGQPEIAIRAWGCMKNYGIPDTRPWKTMVPHTRTPTIEVEYGIFDQALSHASFSFMQKFQLLALVLEGTITPTKAKKLIPIISSFSEKHQDEIVARAIQILGHQIPTPGPDIHSEEFQIESLHKALDTNIQHVENGEAMYETQSMHTRHEHLTLTYKVTITPTGMVLRGPDWSVSNRILRKYSEHSENFMRVYFADEDGSPVSHDSRASQEQIHNRFLQILKGGITIAGRTFEFLGFSNSSLRCHQTWFMAPIEQAGKIVRAPDVIRGLGNFDMRSPAKCAARIGQAFSDTIFSVHIPQTANVIEDKDDVQRNGRCFSDGCGTMSLELFEKVWRALPPNRREARPTVLQIRYRGAKGVVSLDTTLKGQELHIRKSMTKYVAAQGWRDLELCDGNYRPLTMYLNHQFIKILEDLGVPAQNIIELQNEARHTIERIITEPVNAASFLDYSRSGVHAKVPTLFMLMNEIDLSFREDKLLTDIVQIAAMSALRDMKYRGRIPIKEGSLLLGIMDETNTLRDGEVYITMQGYNPDGLWEKSIIVRDRVLVGRAPALHPGDMQIARAVNVPKGSPLGDLSNCIVFSQQGLRDLPSQLSGGDLDGDRFHIIYDERLIPNVISTPADYTAAPPQDLGRRVEIDDIAKFFINFMKMDQLGRIAQAHKIMADLKPLGTRDSDCLVLAKLHSDAVDFSKSGIPADLTMMPLTKGRLRPDFMAPGQNFVVNKFGAAELEELIQDDIDEPDQVNILDPERSPFRYYESSKVLGQLYRSIDERKCFDDMKRIFNPQGRADGGPSLIQKLDRYIDRETKVFQWDHHREFAEKIRQYYEDNMIDIMDSLRPHRGQRLTELEVFSGNVLGKKERASTRSIREANKEVQERFNRDVSSIIRSIVYGDGDWENGDESEALFRSIACWKVALEIEGWENHMLLESWKYVAAAVCLEQLKRYNGGSLRRL